MSDQNKPTVRKSSAYVKSLALCGILIALAGATSFVVLWRMPQSGSVTLFSMLFASLTGYFCGAKWSLPACFAFSMINYLQDPNMVHWAQFLLDYVLAFTALGVSGFFRNKKYGLYTGYLLGVFLRFCCHFASGVIFFGQYTPDGWNTYLYSAWYNGAYIGAELIMTMVLLMIPDVSGTLKKLKSQFDV